MHVKGILKQKVIYLKLLLYFSDKETTNSARKKNKNIENGALAKEFYTDGLGLLLMIIYGRCIQLNLLRATFS